MVFATKTHNLRIKPCSFCKRI